MEIYWLVMTYLRKTRIKIRFVFTTIRQGTVCDEKYTRLQGFRESRLIFLIGNKGWFAVHDFTIGYFRLYLHEQTDSSWRELPQRRQL